MNLDIDELNKLNLKEVKLIETESLSNINHKNYDLDSEKLNDMFNRRK